MMESSNLLHSSLSFEPLLPSAPSLSEQFVAREGCSAALTCGLAPKKMLMRCAQRLFACNEGSSSQQKAQAIHFSKT